MIRNFLSKLRRTERESKERIPLTRASVAAAETIADAYSALAMAHLDLFIVSDMEPGTPAAIVLAESVSWAMGKANAWHAFAVDGRARLNQTPDFD